VIIGNSRHKVGDMVAGRIPCTRIFIG